jgi:hypothetical protein
MPEFNYKEMFEAAKDELKRLHEQRANVEAHLEQLNSKVEAMSKTYNAIAPLVGERSIPTVTDRFIPADIDALRVAGISVAVRYVLDNAPADDFTAALVRDVLRDKGWDWTNYVNPLSTVHTVLTRLVASDAAKRGVKNGKRTFFSTRRAPAPDKTGESSMPFPLGVYRGLGTMGDPTGVDAINEIVMKIAGKVK